MASFYILLLLIPLFLFLKSKSKSNSLKRNCKLPPGPSAIPFIGSLHHLIGAGLPHHALRKLALQYGDLMFLKLGEHPTVVVSSGEVAREVLKTHDLTFSDRYIDLTPSILFYGGQDLAFSPYNEHWRVARKICMTELLSPMQVRSFRSIRECEVGNLIQHISLLSSKGQIVDLSEELMALENNVFLQAIMGVKSKDQKLVLDEVLNLFEVSAGFNLANLFPSSRIARLISGAVRKAEDCHRAFDQLLDILIREHKDQQGVDGEVEDLLAVLLRLHYENNSISMDAVKAIVLDLITAGTDTIALTLDWAMAELMRHPEVMKKAQTEVRRQFKGRELITESDLALAKLSFMQDIIKETFRFHPPGPFIQRKSQEVSTIMGYEIPKGITVLIHAWAIGKFCALTYLHQKSN